jgi:hypothetical protein
MIKTKPTVRLYLFVNMKINILLNEIIYFIEELFYILELIITVPLSMLEIVVDKIYKKK